MDPQQVLLPLLVAVVIANIVLIVTALVLAARRRRQTASVAAVTAPTPDAASRPAGFATVGLPRTAEPAAGVGTYTDALTGLLLPVPFARLVADEDARIQRYRRRPPS